MTHEHPGNEAVYRVSKQCMVFEKYCFLDINTAILKNVLFHEQDAELALEIYPALIGYFMWPSEIFCKKPP